MKKKDVVISMQTVQNVENEENAEAMRFMTDGSYIFDGEAWCVSYDESEVTGLPGTKTTVHIHPKEIVVDRSGALTSRMIFREGEKTSFLYQLPYGNTTLGLDTRKISQSFDDGGGTAEVEYVVDFAHAPLSRNRFTIQVRQTGDRSNA